MDAGFKALSRLYPLRYLANVFQPSSTVRSERVEPRGQQLCVTRFIQRTSCGLQKGALRPGTVVAPTLKSPTTCAKSTAFGRMRIATAGRWQAPCGHARVPRARDLRRGGARGPPARSAGFGPPLQYRVSHQNQRNLRVVEPRARQTRWTTAVSARSQAARSRAASAARPAAMRRIAPPQCLR